MHSQLSAQDATPKLRGERSKTPQIILAAALTTTFAALTPNAKDPKIPMIFATGCGVLTMGLVIGGDQQGRARKPKEL